MASGKEQRMIFDRLSVSGGLCRAMRGKTFALLFTAALASHTLCASAVWAGGEAEPENTCESCHRDSDFLVTNRKLYEYYQEWSGSVHQQEEVTCDDCHGGDATASAKVASHDDGVAASDPASGIYYKNVVDTCGTCHDEVLEGFRESKHFEHVEKKEGEEQGPTCVTCHGSINSEVLSVNSVEAACARCHNEETDNHPDIPEKARAILNRFMSINSFYRYITIRDEPEDAKEFFQAIDPRIQRLAVTWHGFDLKEIDAETREVLATLKAKRREIRSRPKKSKKGQAN
jgi:nitrate/TMAO reductase-like tetraheme cytochrome c subunit